MEVQYLSCLWRSNGALRLSERRMKWFYDGTLFFELVSFLRWLEGDAMDVCTDN